MIKIRRRPSGGGMAHITLGGGRYMLGGFTACKAAVMTAVTGTQNLGMVDANHR